MLSNYYADDNKYISCEHLKSKAVLDMPFRLHNKFEIYFFIAGGVNYFIEKDVYTLKYGDLFVINSSEIHRATFRSGDIYERVVVNFDPEFIRLFDSNSTNLLNCFINRKKGEHNKINLNLVQINEVLKLFSKMCSVEQNRTDTSKLLKLTCLVELLVLLNKVFLNSQPVETTPTLPMKLTPVLEYIDNNICSDLSLKHLEDKFYINRIYLSSLFKKDTGINMHEYIIMKRISKAKELLSDGWNVTEACQMSGFNDYAHFIRSFKTYVGTSPGQYKKGALRIKRIKSGF